MRGRAGRRRAVAAVLLAVCAAPSPPAAPGCDRWTAEGRGGPCRPPVCRGGCEAQQGCAWAA
eukprot:gene50759-19602_t